MLLYQDSNTAQQRLSRAGSQTISGCSSQEGSELHTCQQGRAVTARCKLFPGISPSSPCPSLRPSRKNPSADPSWGCWLPAFHGNGPSGGRSRQQKMLPPLLPPPGLPVAILIAFLGSRAADVVALSWEGLSQFFPV